jgi:hypothetical protein
MKKCILYFQLVLLLPSPVKQKIKWDIQIILDTLRGGDKVSHNVSCCFILEAFDRKFILDCAFRHFLTNSFYNLKRKNAKIVTFGSLISHMNQKNVQKCHTLFEWRRRALFLRLCSIIWLHI